MAIDTRTKNKLRSVVSRQTIHIHSDDSGESFETITIDATARRTSAAVYANQIAVWSDVAFRYKAGDGSVTADANSPLLPGGVGLMVFDWNPGDYLGILYDGTNTGTLNIIGVY